MLQKAEKMNIFRLEGGKGKGVKGGGGSSEKLRRMYHFQGAKLQVQDVPTTAISWVKLPVKVNNTLPKTDVKGE